MKVTDTNTNSSQVNKLLSIAEIDKHISFIEAVLKKYSYEEWQLLALIEKTKKKQQDKLLNMSIIGEFSSGKSSFINALLRNELLSSCSLQGTTVANTVIEYSDECAVELTDKERKVKRILFPSTKEMIDKIESFTTDSDFAQTVRSVKICFPAEGIKDKIRIIDTPGTNATEIWHEGVTKNAIKSLSDASVILMDATKPFPETICRFVSENLKKVLPQCVFVLTKFDMIEESEREQTIKYSQLKVKEFFGIDNAPVLPYSSMAVSEKTEDDIYKISLESEQKLFDFVAKQKAVAQLKKVITFTDLIYDSTVSYVQNVSAQYAEEFRSLVKENKTNLPEFIAFQKKQRRKDFESNAKIHAETVINTVYSKNYEACERLNMFTSGKSAEEINYYVSANFLNVTLACADEIIGYANNEIYPIVKYLIDSLKGYYTAFSGSFGEFGNLDSRKGDLNALMSVPRRLDIDFRDKIEEGKKISRELQAHFMNINSYKTSNSIISEMFEQYKSNARTVMYGYMKSMLNRICYDIKCQYERIIYMFSEQIVQEIENCGREYNTAVTEKIQEEKNLIKSRINEINRDIRSLDERKHMLLLIETQIDSLIGCMGDFF